MRGAALLGVLDGLDRFQRGAGGVFLGLQHVHRSARRAGGVDAGAPRFVGEADEVRVGEAILELRHVRTLAVFQVQHRAPLHLDGLGLGSFVAAVGECDHRRPVVEIDAGVRHLAGGQHHQVGIDRGVLVEDQVPEVHLARTAAGDLVDLAFGEDDALGLGAAVEVLAHARHAQVRVHDNGIDLRVGILEVHCLLDAGGAAVARAVFQVLTAAIAARTALTGALYEHD